MRPVTRYSLRASGEGRERWSRRTASPCANDYHTDADDVAVEYVGLARRDPRLAAAVRQSRALRDTLIQVLDEGWTSSAEQDAIRYLRQQ